MTLFAFLLSAAVGGGCVVAWRERPKTAAAIGLVATAVCLLAAIVMPVDASLTVGQTILQVDAYARLFLVAGSLALLVSQVVGLAHGWQRELPLATLGALGLIGVALTVGTPAAAMLIVAAAGTFVVIASLERAISMPAVRAAASGFRLAAIAGFMGLVAMAMTGDDPIFVAPDVLAGATLMMAAAVAIRVGAIPLHAPVARLIERARTAALPLLAAWVPAAFAVVALGWTSTIVAIGATTPVVLVVVAFGVLTIALASTVVLIDDDLVRWLGYGVIADGGFVLLALAGNSVSTISAGLAWLVCFALARSIVACVLLGFQGAFDARRTRELEGWLRRTPVLGAALLGALVIGFGIPGTIPWQVRLELAEGALGQQLGVALVAVGLLPLVPIARLAWNGIRPIGDVVAAGKSERFVAPPRTEAIDGSQATQPGVAAEPGAAASASEAVPEVVVPSEIPTETPAPQVDVTPEISATTSQALEPEVSAATIPPLEPEVPDTLWAAADARASAEAAIDVAPATTGEAASGEGPRAAAASPAAEVRPEVEAAPQPEAKSVPVDTLSSTGRAVRAARKASQPTIAAPTGVGTGGAPAGDSGSGDAGPGHAERAGTDRATTSRASAGEPSPSRDVCIDVGRAAPSRAARPASRLGARPDADRLARYAPAGLGRARLCHRPRRPRLRGGTRRRTRLGAVAVGGSGRRAAGDPRSVGRGEHPAVDVSLVSEELLIAEPEGDLCRCVLRAVRGMHEVLRGLEREVAADGARVGLLWTRGAVDGAHDGDRVGPLEDGRHERRRGDEVDEAAEERALTVDLVVRLGQGAVDLDELEADQLQPAVLVALQEPTDQQALDAVGLDEDEGPFVHASPSLLDAPSTA